MEKKEEKYDKIKRISKIDLKEITLVISQKTNIKYICKSYIIDKYDKKKILSEYRINKEFKHQNIINIHEIFVADSIHPSLNIICEYAEGGDLYSRIQKQKQNKIHFKESEIIKWFTQICNGLEYIHSKNVIHRDLQTKNIFLTKNDQIKIGNFGNAKKIITTIQDVTKLIDSTSILAPELIENKQYTKKIDIWSLGIILYELMTFRKPFEIQSISELIKKIKKADYPHIQNLNYNTTLVDLVRKLLKINPDERPSLNYILSKFFFINFI